MRVLSLFDGIACAREALRILKINPSAYLASEIDEDAIGCTKRNWPDIVQLGDIKHLSYAKTSKGVTVGGHASNPIKGNIDLLIGGSPCQDLSIAKSKREGLRGKKSSLFFEYLRILHETKPKWFILENVASMSIESRNEITRHIGVEPIMIDAALVSAQKRKRLFWTNIPNLTQPKDKGIVLNDIIHETRGEKFDLEKYIVKGNQLKWITDPLRLKKKYTQVNGEKAMTMRARQYANWNGTYVCKRVGKIGKGGQGERIYSTEGKAITLPSSPGYSGTKTGIYLIKRPRGKNKGGIEKSKTPTLTTSSWEDNNHLVVDGYYTRRLTPIECERLQSVRDGYTDTMSDRKRYVALGNAFNAKVIAHIIKHIPQ